MNILTNAIQTIDNNKGTINITTKNVGTSVVIFIKDNGKGMNEDIAARIFEPFFTTKDVGDGTGLGLSISYGIIQKHQGKIEVKSKVGEGSTFIIFLPQKQDL